MNETIYHLQCRREKIYMYSLLMSPVHSVLPVHRILIALFISLQMSRLKIDFQHGEWEPLIERTTLKEALSSATVIVAVLGGGQEHSCDKLVSASVSVAYPQCVSLSRSPDDPPV